jgi:hypothetical protein
MFCWSQEDVSVLFLPSATASVDPRDLRDLANVRGEPVILGVQRCCLALGKVPVPAVALSEGLGAVVGDLPDQASTFLFDPDAAEREADLQA